MKRINIIIIVAFFICVYSCSNRKPDSIETNKKSKISINEIINLYDPQLSAKQNSYRIFGKTVGQKLADADMFGPQSVENLLIIKSNINYFMNSNDTIKSFMLSLSNIAAKYGSELFAHMKDADAKKEFQIKWRTYQEGVAEVMNYDLEMGTHFLEALIFLRDNQTKYKVENDMIYFFDDSNRKEYQRLLEICGDPKL